MQRIVIVGGGMAGLCTAYSLLRQGYKPTVLDAGALDADTGWAGASWAAAGMLAPIHELEPTELPLLAAGQASLALHHQWATNLLAAGHDVHLRTEGTLEVALTRDDQAWLHRHYQQQQQLGLAVQWVEGRALQQLEPALSPQLPAGIYAPNDVQVDHRRLLPALAAACKAAGAKLLHYTEAKGWEMNGGKILVQVRTGDERHTLAADQLVIATGAAPVPWPQPEAVKPVRGQMVALDPAGFGLQRVVRIRSRTYGNAYIVPKADRIVLGSTSEEMGHDARLTAGGLLDILRKGYAAVPGLYDLPVLATWAGLRPATASRQPHLTETAPGIWHLNGLYRHGILLGPLLGTAAAAVLTGQSVPTAAQPFVTPHFT